MKYDIVIVLYNSQKWLPGCLAALANAQYNPALLNLIFVDNASDDGTLQLLQQLQQQYSNFGGFTVLPQQNNTGFARGCNIGAAAGSAPYVFFLNADTELLPEAFARLDAAIEKAPENTVAFECRQIPYEHPKYYNPVTLATSWCSGAALVVQRQAFAAVGGFDESFFMYCEDVDLSWRLRLAGGTLQYVPTAVVRHYAYQMPGQQKPRQIAGHLAGDLALRYKFGSKNQIAAWHNWADASLLKMEPEAEAFWQQQLLRVKQNKTHYRSFWRKKVKKSGFYPTFMQGDYEYMRTGPYVPAEPTQAGPRFSVLVRTHSRPQLLAQTLQSLTAQTYRNFEVVVVEDGEPTAQALLQNGFEGLDLQYIATGQPVGRCKAGNLAMQAARGEYFNFLDDDDYFFADHLEHMAALIQQNQGAKMVAAASLEGVCRYPEDNLCNWQIAAMRQTCYTGVTFAEEAFSNRFSIQAVAFHRSLYSRYGGLNEALDALEDWDLWVRYMQHTPVVCSAKATSLYKTPANALQAAQRFVQVRQYALQVRQKFEEYTAEVSAAQLSDIAEVETGDSYVQLCGEGEQWVQSALAIYGSTTWRITKPLRALQKALVPRALRNNLEYAGNIIFANPNMFTQLGQYRQFVTYANASLGWRLTRFLRKGR